VVPLRSGTAALALFVAAAVAAPVAVASRAPTLAERAAITRAAPLSLRNTPSECVWLSTRVANNSRYALVPPVYLNTTAAGSRCARFASNGMYVLRRGTTWTIVFEGSDLPRCSLGIPRDLVRCVR
jgi:hypothetical protein